MKLKLILAMLLPLMRLGEHELRNKDENSTGFDDIAADQIKAAIDSLEKFTQS